MWITWVTERVICYRSFGVTETNVHAITSDKSSIFRRGISPWVIASPEKHTGGTRKTLRHHNTAAAGTSYFFFVSKNPPFQSVLFGVQTGATRPWQMFRDACPFASAYYVLILGIRTYKASNTRPIPNVHARDSRRWIENPGWQKRVLWNDRHTIHRKGWHHNNTLCLWSFFRKEIIWFKDEVKQICITI